jgi:uncharacterized membrane protein YkvA (DUF1232 family)
MTSTRDAVRVLEASVTPQDEATILARTERIFSKLTLIRSAASLLINARLLVSMLRDSAFSMTWKTKATILGALLYLVIPTDLTPDVIPGIGFLDDALVLRWVISRLRDEVDRYTLYLNGKHG